jgi:hypothetical protein
MICIAVVFPPKFLLSDETPPWAVRVPHHLLSGLTELYNMYICTI